jgi:CRP-like cAMP-binding protein
LQGQAQVEYTRDTGERITLYDLAEGDVFGEIALVNETSRTAHVIATVPTRVLAIDWAALERIRRIFPKVSTRLFLNLSRILGTRLAFSNPHLTDAMKRVV